MRHRPASAPTSPTSATAAIVETAPLKKRFTFTRRSNSRTVDGANTSGQSRGLSLNVASVQDAAGTSETSNSLPTTAKSTSPNGDSTLTSPPPRWSKGLSTTIGMLRTTLEMNKDNLARARAITFFAAAPSPVTVKIKKVKIPRRSDCLPEGMSTNDASGHIVGEWIDYHRDDVASNERVVLYIHGGAYILCSRKSHRGITWRISKHSMAKVLVIDYRLSPEAVFPLALHDALCSYIWLTSPDGGGFKPSSVIIMGDSAGGGLSLATMLWLRDNPERGWGLPAGLGLLSPWLDLDHSMPSFKLAVHDYLPEGSKDPKYIHENRKQYYITDNSLLKNPYVSPLYAKEFHETRPTPPMLIQLGSIERLRDEILHFVTDVFPRSPIQLEMYDDGVHVFQLLVMARLKIADMAIRRLGAFAISCASSESPSGETRVFERKMTRILNSKGHPSQDLSVEEMRRMVREGYEILASGGHPPTVTGRMDGAEIPVAPRAVASPEVDDTDDHIDNGDEEEVIVEEDDDIDDSVKEAC